MYIVKYNAHAHNRQNIFTLNPIITLVNLFGQSSATLSYYIHTTVNLRVRQTFRAVHQQMVVKGLEKSCVPSEIKSIIH